MSNDGDVNLGVFETNHGERVEVVGRDVHRETSTISYNDKPPPAKCRFPGCRDGLQPNRLDRCTACGGTGERDRVFPDPNSEGKKRAMNVYLLEQEENEDYDTYDSFVCIAATEDDAIDTCPSGEGRSRKWTKPGRRYSTWAVRRESVKCTLIGVAVDGAKPGVVCASFNAG